MPVILFLVLFDSTGGIEKGATLHKIPNTILSKFDIPRHMSVTVSHFLLVLVNIVLILLALCYYANADDHLQL